MYNHMDNAGMFDLYVSVGVATSPNFIDGFRNALHHKLAQDGKKVHSELLFPYGDWSRSVTAQLREVGHDLSIGVLREQKSIGGSRILDVMEGRWLERGFQSDTTILVGHSAGGVASVHAARLLLEREDKKSCPIIMIGSPRSRIPPELKASVFYVDAERTDPVTRIGTFGGWALGNYRIPVWQNNKNRPVSTLSLPIIGGHADYFRESEPFINENGESNLEVTLNAIWSWLEDREYTSHR